MAVDVYVPEKKKEENGLDMLVKLTDIAGKIGSFAGKAKTPKDTTAIDRRLEALDKQGPDVIGGGKRSY